MLTAYSEPPDLIDVINRGPVYRFITKPWDTSDLIQTVENALDHARLTQENASLLQQTQRRLAALEAVYEVSAASAHHASFGDIVGEVAHVLERVVPLDVSASFLAADGSEPARLNLYCRAPVCETQVEKIRASAIEAHNTLSGEEVDEDNLLVRISGPGLSADRDEEFALESQLFVPLISQGRHAGVIVVAARAPGAFDRDDERILDILANQLAESILTLRRQAGRERARLERMVEGMADGLVMTDATGEVVVHNAVAAHLLGCSDEEGVSARQLRDKLGFYPFELVRGWERLGAHAIAEDVRLGERVLGSVISPVTSPEGALEGVVLVLRDVTSQRQLEKRKEEFVNDVTHEIRTPLTSMAGALDLVLGGNAGELTDKQRKFLFMVKNSIGRLNGLVDNLLDLSKAAQHHLRVAPLPGRLDDVVAEAVDRYRPAFETRGVSVKLLRPEGPVPVSVDKDRMDQVLDNIFSNATRFTPEGGELQVEVYSNDASEGQANAGFSIWNSGSLVEPEDIERIFEPYEQTSAEGEGGRGTGLGLPICRTIVEAHGGRIWAESAPEKGTAFVVVLPREVELDDEKTEQRSPAGVHGRPGENAGVLLVEDDRATAYTLKSHLLAAGFQVDVAHRAEDALMVARAQRPSVMVVDVRMPDIDGVELIEIVRHDPETRGTPIIAISAYDEGDRARRARAHTFLAKPIEPARLVATVTELAFRRLSVGQGVLVVDDDATTRTLCADTLKARGYNVATAEDVETCMEQVSAFRPDLILLDLILPDGDPEGFALLSRLKADRNTASTSVIVLSARTQTEVKVRALRLGADDFIAKPFDESELAARVETVLRRRELERASSPTTRLPGGLAIESEVNRRIAVGRPFSLCYLDLDNLKAFNDYYGYPKADAVIQQTGEILRQVVNARGRSDDFIGHIAGDDFVLISEPERVDALCNGIVDSFGRIIPLYYNRGDRQRGHIDAVDRQGQMRKFPIMGISVVAVTDPGGLFASHAQMAYRAAELKQQAKAIEGSVFLRDEETQKAAP
jgi:signal transduction histidine kinase/DNA-binding response OmpR family regulator